MNVQIAQIAAVQTVNATGGLAGVNIGQYHGFARIVLQHAAASAGVVEVKMQHSANGSTGWADVPGLAFEDIEDAAGLQEIEVQTDELRAHVRLHVTVDDNTVVLGASIVGQRQYSTDYSG